MRSTQTLLSVQNVETEQNPGLCVTQGPWVWL